MPLAEKRALADYVIENTGSPEHLAEETDRVLDAICEALGIAKERYPGGPGR
jgi:dephospho-CoA kinase